MSHLEISGRVNTENATIPKTKIDDKIIVNTFLCLREISMKKFMILFTKFTFVEVGFCSNSFEVITISPVLLLNFISMEQSFSMLKVALFSRFIVRPLKGISQIQVMVCSPIGNETVISESFSIKYSPSLVTIFIGGFTKNF